MVLASLGFDQSPVNSGLVAYYNLEEGRGGSTTDLLGLHPNATLANGPTWVILCTRYFHPTYPSDNMLSCLPRIPRF
jgi:hypothetical protein